MKPPLTIHSAKADHVVAGFGAHVLALWTGTPSVFGAQQVEIAVLEAAKASPGRAVYFAVLRWPLALPDALVRAIFIRLGRRVDRDLSCIAVVVEGAGFWASALRGVVLGLGLSAAVPFPLRCYSSLGEAADWVIPRQRRLGAEIGTLAEIAEAFATMEGLRINAERAAAGRP
jgi:hypothetical protein